MKENTLPRHSPKPKASDPRPFIWDRLGQRGGEAAAITVDRIVRVAMELADREGLDTISMRRIASELGSGVMSLYHYVPSKDDLLDLLLDAAIGEVEIPKEPSGDWRGDLRTVAARTRACLKHHVWLAGLLNRRPALGPHRFAQFEFALSAVSGLGLDFQAMRRMVGSLYVYILGFVALELSEGQALRRAVFRDMPAPYVKKLMATGRFPNVARLLSEDRLAPPGDEAFEDGLDLVLEGMTARLKAASPHGDREMRAQPTRARRS
ncbi:MAG TPA: TetR/AcrR family transcriptional regulator [Bryobacteraceae bacterium]